MSTKKQAPSSGITKTDLKKALKSAPNELHPDHVRVASYHTPSELRESAVVLFMGSSGYPEQFTIHRPIGVTDLKDDDWVLTRTSDVMSLLARAKDPRQAEIEKRRGELKLELQLAEKLLEKKDGKVYYPGDFTFTRSEYLDNATKLHKSAEQNQKPGAAKPDRNSFLGAPQKAAEKAISDFSKGPKVTEALDAACPHTFRTMGGVLENQPQVAIPVLHGKQIREVLPTLAKAFYKVVGMGEGITIVTSTVVEAPASTPPEPEVNEEEEGTDAQANIGILLNALTEVSVGLAQANTQLEELMVVGESIGHGMSKAETQKLKEVHKALVVKLSSLLVSLYDQAKDPAQLIE